MKLHIKIDLEYYVLLTKITSNIKNNFSNIDSIAFSVFPIFSNKINTKNKMMGCGIMPRVLNHGIMPQSSSPLEYSHASVIGELHSIASLEFMASHHNREEQINPPRTFQELIISHLVASSVFVLKPYL